MGGRVGEWAGAAPDSASLNPTLTQLHPAVADRDHIPPGDAGAEADDGAVDPLIGEEGLARKDRRGESARDASDPAGFVPEIGRASCRERVWRDAEIQVVGVYIKK